MAARCGPAAVHATAGRRYAVRRRLRRPEHADSGCGFLCGAPAFPRAIVVSGRPVRLSFRGQPTANRTRSGPDRSGRHVRRADAVRHRGLLAAVADPNAWVTVTGRSRAATLDATVTDFRCIRRLTARRDATRLASGRASLRRQSPEQIARAERRRTGCTQPGATSSSGTRTNARWCARGCGSTGSGAARTI